MKFNLDNLWLCAGSLFLASTLQAGKPVWTFFPRTPTSVTVETDDTITVQYEVTNQSTRTHTLRMVPIPGIQQVMTAGNCPTNFTLAYHQSCILTLRIIGRSLSGDTFGGPKVCDKLNPLECYQPKAEHVLNIKLVAAPGDTTLSSSVSTLALRTNGRSRIITITNTGTETAFNVVYRISPALPAGTTIFPATCGTLEPGGRCFIRITPGATPSATPGNVNPTPITLAITGRNTNTVRPTINILTYGSVYQSGYVFAINDNTVNTGSIGGKVAALSNQASFGIDGRIWSSDNAGNPVFDPIPGINQNSINPPEACNGALNGACNTNVIVNYYSPPQTNPAVNLSFYAAGLCKATIGGYSDWYLPAICEMGYDNAAQNTGCGIPPNPPTLQNMQTNLVENGNIGNLFGPYWSSTQSSINFPTNAWNQFFAVGGGNFQDEDPKDGPISVRCVRAITG
ncbi:DUF1566 domain-containing protein [Legionella jamestowniensis]|uniref:NHL repeat protein n=1 Tax=Legionella jamestowniensis TaxID=455 RepID=A0A0W0UJ98_9GAMM|nr:DUF1566 domain-containing protein [Legionella jamestowniensis]KTD07702.1 NHL repeat protein [Legionella jamestowniensis]OCH99440.1 hypothetical protein A8135_07090 [Legionella jamestowniensis]SFL60883.1 Protein of unknown function [Legionella jamestowniensis DSM 19215]